MGSAGGGFGFDEGWPGLGSGPCGMREVGVGTAHASGGVHALLRCRRLDGGCW